MAEAWQRRRRDGTGGYVHALVNEGRAAGASLPHSHSQLVWMREAPPAVANERADRLVSRRRERRARSSGPTALVRCLPGAPPACPTSCARAGAHGGAGSRRRSRLLRDVVRRLRAVEGPVPWNAWLHDAAHWHLEVLPRLTVFAGIELGAGVYVNTLAPEDAAAALRTRTSRRRQPATAPPASCSSRSRNARAASIAAPRFRPLSFACLISITVSSASMS